MNALGISLLWMSLQVTLLCLTAMLLLLSLGRDARAAGRLIGLSLGLVLILAPLACIPFPRGWTWQSVDLPNPSTLVRAGSRNARSSSPAASGLTQPIPEQTRGSGLWSVSEPWMRWLWQKLPTSSARLPDSCEHWPAWVAYAFLAGMGAGLIRFIVSLVAVFQYRRRSAPITDAFLLEKLAVLQEAMLCRAPVQLRQSADLRSPVTVGCLRPAILLPPDWPSWSASEQQAVLAHELAHIGHHDYLVGVIARLAIVVHFYHPLVYWLAARLQLHQELAADAEGSACAGGADPYLRTLAQFIVRQDSAIPRWPARTFLPARGILLKRITMLRNREVLYPRSRPSQLLRAVALLVVLAGVSALRSPGQSPAPSPAIAQEPLTAPSLAASSGTLDLAYAPVDGFGLFLIRPAALFARPEWKALARDANRELMTLFDCHDRSQLRLPVEAIDQVTSIGNLSSLPNPTPHGPRQSYAFHCTLVRTVQPFDWKSFIQSAAELIEIRHAGHVYYKIAQTSRTHFFLAKGACFYIPDSRTIVTESEPALRRLVERGPTPPPQYANAPGWKQVENDVVAWIGNNQDAIWAGQVRELAAKLPAVSCLLLGPSQVVMGINMIQGTTLHGFARCDNERAVNRLCDGLSTSFDQARSLIENAWGDPASWIASLPPPQQQSLRRFADLIETVQIHRAGTIVEVSSHTDLSLATLVEMLRVLIIAQRQTTSAWY